MSTPHNRAHNPWHGLLHAVAERLIPLFQTPGQTTEYARSAAREAIAAYRPESRADYASIGRILALSLATIAAIGQSATPDLPPALQLRFLTKANTLSRSAEQAERTMTQRRRHRDGQPEAEDYLLAPPNQETTPPTQEAQAAITPANEPRTSPPQAEPTDEAIFAQIDAAIAEFRALASEHPSAPRPPFAAMPAAPPPPSFRQTLKNHAPMNLAHPTT